VVERSTTGSFGGEEDSLGQKDGNFTTDTDLAVDTRYFYRTKAVDTSGNSSPWSDTKSSTTLLVGQTDIAANTIVASHISGNTVEGYFGSFGTMEAGVLKSSNYCASEGMRFDLDNEVVNFGGSQTPDLYWDGVDLSIRGSITITGGSGISSFSDAGDLVTKNEADLESTSKDCLLA
ncbi:MAG: hypothetical protein GY858_04285, partial [Candidatus Omnitrophica bacterium]|nr:hypothetical protein [Candidatus Omnitrophota bacterium]